MILDEDYILKYIETFDKSSLVVDTDNFFISIYYTNTSKSLDYFVYKNDTIRFEIDFYSRSFSSSVFNIIQKINIYGKENPYFKYSDFSDIIYSNMDKELEFQLSTIYNEYEILTFKVVNKLITHFNCKVWM